MTRASSSRATLRLFRTGSNRRTVRSSASRTAGRYAVAAKRSRGHSLRSGRHDLAGCVLRRRRRSLDDTFRRNGAPPREPHDHCGPSFTGDRYAGEWPRERFAATALPTSRARSRRANCTRCCSLSEQPQGGPARRRPRHRSALRLGATDRMGWPVQSTTPPVGTTMRRTPSLARWRLSPSGQWAVRVVSVAPRAVGSVQ